MARFISGLQTALGDENGATAIEYALIAALISVAIVATVETLGLTLSGSFGAISLLLSQG